jgi:hypothetical protein
VSPEKPHGLDYSLTLHGPDGERPVGFDSAHPVARQQQGGPQVHRHRLRTIRTYEVPGCGDSARRFLDDGGRVLRESGVIS